MPAQLIWTNGTSNGNWNTAANWTDPLGGPSVVPGATDYAYFGNLGSNTPCLMNASSATVDRIIMDGNYTSTFTLGSGNTLTTANQFVQYGDFVFGGSGTLNVGGSLSIYGDVTNTPMMYTVATIDVSTDIFLQNGGTINATAYSGDKIDITCLAFDHDGTINVGTMSNGGNITITGDFYQWNSAVTNVFGHSTLTFDSNGTPANDPTIAGTINLGDATAYYQYGFATIITDTQLYLSGGTLQTYQYGPNYIEGDVFVDNSGEIIIGDGTAYNTLVLTDGSLVVGGTLLSSTSTAGTLTINHYSTLDLLTAASATEFNVAEFGVVDMNGGFITMNLSRVDTMLVEGTVNALTSTANYITGNVSIVTAPTASLVVGNLNIGSGAGASSLLMPAGKMTVGAEDASAAATGGKLKLTSGSLLYIDDVDADMLVVASGGEVTMQGSTISLNAGFGGMRINSGGTLTTAGSDTIVGSLSNSGQISFDGSLHTLGVSVNFTQTSGGELDMRLDDGEICDILNIGGVANLDGLLDLTGLTSLAGAQEWFLLFYNSRSGTFAVNFPDLDPAWLDLPGGTNFRVTN